MTRDGRAVGPAVALATLVLTLLGTLWLATAPAHAAPGTASAGGVATVEIPPGEETPGTTPEADPGTVPEADEPGTNGPGGPAGPDGPRVRGNDDGTVGVEIEGLTDKPGTSVTVLLGLTLISLLPAILLTCTSFTKILVVLSLTRNALGLQQTPPNQVLAGLALFLSLFIMGPVLGEMNDKGLQPYLDGDKNASQAWDSGIDPLREFMLDNTDDEELRLLTEVADRELPDSREDVGMSTLVPAFILTELKQAFIIGFIIFVPFLIIDIVVSGALMALGMMMMPPVMVSLPFKLLLFVLVDGWALIIKSIVSSYG